MKRWLPFRALFRKEKLDAEMTAEMRAHLELQTAENLRRGLAPDEAHYAARRQFGGVEQIKEQARELRGGMWWENFCKDVRHGSRLLGRAPGFAIAAIASLAIGIGANTAMFSIVDGVLLQPLPYPEADELVTLWSENRSLGIAQQPSSFGNVSDWQSSARTLAGVAAFDPFSVIVTAGEPRRTSGALVTPNLADVLRVLPRLGRMFTQEEAARNAAVTVISHAAWQKHFGGVTDILGRTIELDGRATEIVGVMPEGFSYPDRGTEFWLPHTLRTGAVDPRLTRGAGPWRVLARLAPRASREAAGAELATLAATLEKEYPANAGLGVRVVPLAEQVVGRGLRTALWLLLAAVGAVLLIACSNVGNLLLARGQARQHEFALRLSLGATRGRLVAQLLAETLMLVGLAAVVGLGLAVLAIEAVQAFAPGGIPRLAEVTLDLRMLAFAGALSLATTCGFGLWPALQSTRCDPLGMLRDGARGATESPRGRRWRGALVAVEFALALVLFAGAGLLLRSFSRLLAVDPGFQIENVLLAPMRLPASRPIGDSTRLAERVVERVAALPGVMVAAVSEEILLGERGQLAVSAESAAGGDARARRLTLSNDSVTPGYFRAMGVSLRAGRIFDDRDGPLAPAVVVVNETLARQLWGGEPALGHRLRLGPPNSPLPWATVVGVIADQRRQGLDRAAIPQAFWPLAQRPSRAMNLIVRTHGDPAGLGAAVRQAVQAIDPSVPVETVTTLRQRVEGTLAPRRFHTGLLTGFAAIALVLAGVGIFGLMHYSVARRTHEIGVRAALGASGAQILRQILSEGLTLASVGIVLGLVGAVAGLRLLSTLLFEVSATDPLALGAAAGALFVLAAAACFLPARRASRIDPMVALRAE